jgi:hypothetical protein
MSGVGIEPMPPSSYVPTGHHVLRVVAAEMRPYAIDC